MDSGIAFPWCGSLSTVSHGKAKSVLVNESMAERVDELVRECCQTSAASRAEPEIRLVFHPHFGKYFYIYLAYSFSSAPTFFLFSLKKKIE